MDGWMDGMQKQNLLFCTIQRVRFKSRPVKTLAAWCQRLQLRRVSLQYTCHVCVRADNYPQPNGSARQTWNSDSWRLHCLSLQCTDLCFKCSDTVGDCRSLGYIRRSPRPSNRLATEKRKERRDGAQKGRGFVLMDLGVDWTPLTSTASR